MNEPEIVPDVAGDDITPVQVEVSAGNPDGVAVDPDDDRELTVEEKLDVLAGVIEYQDEQILEIKTATARIAQVLIRLTQAVDGAVEAESGIVGPNGERLSRKQRRDIQFGRS